MELHKSQRLAEKEAHDLSMSLKECKDDVEKLKDRINAVTSTNVSLADRLNTSEIDLDKACRELEDLRAQVASLRNEVRAGQTDQMFA